MDAETKELVKYFTVPEVAACLRLAEEVVRQKARAGEIGSCKPGKAYLFTKFHIDTYIATFGKEGSNEPR